MKSLVTGGAGFIGHHLVRALVERGDEVWVLDDFSTGSRERLHSGATLAEGDIRDRSMVESLFRGERFDAVYHTAALARVQPSVRDPINTHDVNVTGTLNLLKAAAGTGVRRFVYSSSSSIYGDQSGLPFHEGMIPNPMHPYGLQKWMGEELCRVWSKVYGLDTVALRYFNVYGPGMIEEGAYCTAIQAFLGQCRRGEKLTLVGDGSQRRDFTHVSDIVSGNLLAAYAAGRFDGEAFNLGYGGNVSIREVADRILNAYGRSWQEDVSWLPARTNEPMATLADRSKARRALGWEPKVAFADGLEELLETARPRECVV
jgi:UDP-glucose 4-epimerase